MKFAERSDSSWKNLSGAIVCKKSNVYISRLIKKVRLYNPRQNLRGKREEEATASSFASIFQRPKKEGVIKTQPKRQTTNRVELVSNKEEQLPQAKMLKKKRILSR